MVREIGNARELRQRLEAAHEPRGLLDLSPDPEGLAAICLKGLIVAAGGRVEIAREDLLSIRDLEFHDGGNTIIVTAGERTGTK